MLPFHLIIDNILNDIDWYTRILFLYVVMEYYKHEPDFLFQLNLNFLIGSIYLSIHDYSVHMYSTCRYPCTHQIFSHWSPFSKKKAAPIASLSWNTNYPYTSIYYNNNEIHKQALCSVNTNCLQLRLSIHNESKETMSNYFYLTKIRKPRCVIESRPLHIIIADANEQNFHICENIRLSKMRQQLLKINDLHVLRKHSRRIY